MNDLLYRDSEIERLEKAWSLAREGRPQLAMLWGRRRVGKTFLLGHFVQGKPAVFFGATQQAEAVELARFAEAVRRDLGGRVGDLAGDGFASWEAALRFLAALAVDRPVAVVLDEVPYLAASTPGFASVVQAVWDRLPVGTRLLLVLCGSAVGVVEGMLGPAGALHGRPTLALRIDPFDPPAARSFLPRLAPAALLEAFAACGGYPLHLRTWDARASTRENLIALAATAGGVLLEDAASLLREQLAEAPGYPRILAAIGRGSTKFSEIAGQAGQRVEHPLDVLVRAGFVRKSLPIGAPRAARPLYEIDDVYLAFWFRVLYSDLALIESGQGPAVLERALPRWQAHVGWVFEEAARAHARRIVARGALPSDLVVGRWWAATGEPCEADVLGLRGNRTALLGEARWQPRPLGLGDLAALRQKLVRVPQPLDDVRLVLWGRAGVKREVTRTGALAFDAEDVLD